MSADEPLDEIISTYTLDEAEDDGLLVATSTLLPEYNGYKPHIVSMITTNLLVEQGYFQEDEGMNGPAANYKRANIVDLLNQVGPKISATLRANPEEWLVTGMKVEGPNGRKYEAWAQLNEKGRWTLMLPSDY